MSDTGIEDVDAELLAMASGDSDSEGEDGEMLETPIVDEGSMSEEAKPSVEKVDEAAGTRRGVAQKVRKRGKKKVSKREIEDELDDLADSPSPPASIGSGAMSESSADAPASPAADIDDGPLYPVEGQFLSASDKDRILSLPEIERETILAERAQEILTRQQDLQLKKALAVTQAAASKHKRKAAAADLDESSRKTSRPKTERAGRSALDDYKKAREAKGAERTSRLDPKRDRRGARSSTPASDRDADGESEVEWAEPSSDRRGGREDPPPDLKDIDRCRIGRSFFAKVCFYPNFEKTMTGCFARVSIGMNRETGQNMYRMTQIRGFTEGKPYSLELSNGKTIQCDQYAIVAHGSAEKPWPFSACSDSHFTEGEFQRYKETLEKDRRGLSKRGWLHNKLDDIHKLLSPDWTEQALNEKFAKQKAMEKRLDPANAAKLKLDAIKKRKAEAEKDGDEEEVAKADGELAALENNAATANGSIVKPKPSPIKPTGAQTQQERLALLNIKTKSKNSTNIRNALLEERRKLHQGREEARAAAKAEAEKQAALLALPKDDMRDLFGDMSDLSRAGTPVSGVGTPRMRRSRAGTPVNGVGCGGAGKKRTGLAVVGARQKEKAERGDELGGLDLGIDVEI